MESAIYIVATPIGNLSDITIRGLEVLRGVDIIAAEDTRHTRRLLDHHGITAKLVAYHEHNESEKALYLLAEVQEGKSIALVSDAGTPLISDPGHVLVSLAKKGGVKVVPIPGPSALIAALSASGLPCGKFIYEGFLPVKQKAKRDLLEMFRYEARTVVFYESPHRVLNSLEVLADLFPGRHMVIARELTKRFETITSGLTEELLSWTRDDDNQQRGEFVLVLSGASRQGNEDLLNQEKMLSRLVEYLPPKKAVQLVTEFFGGDKKSLYNRAVMIRNEKS
ncbi:MAG: 16S rRNA (cytidine1402-2'-O)-methyltransferase [Oleiphilaceae bacterium]